MPPGRDNPTSTTPMLVPAEPLPTAVPAPISYGATAAHVIIDGDVTSPLVPVVVHNNNSNSNEEINLSAPVCRDLPFAILFLLHAVVMGWLGIFTAPQGYDEIQINTTFIEDQMRQGDDISEEDVQQFQEFVAAAAAYLEVYPLRILLYIIIPCCLLAYAFGAIATAFVIKPHPKEAVYGCLICSVAWMAFILILGTIASHSFFMVVGAGLALTACWYYVSIAWQTVPFAAVNLKISLEGIGRNSGTYAVAFLFAELGFVWVLYWLYVVVGTFAYKNHQCELEHPEANFDMSSPDYDTDICHPPGLVILGFLLSLYWTNTIIMNTVQVIVAGVMATWCFDKPEADGCCSGAIQGSIYRSLTYSFGSICFGSLLQAIVSVFRYLLESARNQRDRNNDNACGALLLCILECLARLLEDILTYFNQWAYVYCGVYGYSYLDSGKAVMELFKNRGFTAIITDKLVDYVLGFTTFTVAVLTGIAGILIEKLVSRSYADSVKPEESYLFGPLPAGAFAFGVSFIVGLWIVSVMMNVVKGAVNTLIVCWADSPAMMQSQHPALSRELVQAWSGVFSMGFGNTTPVVIV